jgi:hypothetical protein
MGFGAAGNYWWQGQDAFSENQIGELLRFVGRGTGADEWAGFFWRDCFSGVIFWRRYFLWCDFFGLTFFGLAFWGREFLLV